MSLGINLVVMAGYLGGDPKISDVNGTPKMKFTIALSESWTDKAGQRQERTEWVACEAWRKTAETIGRYLHKGDPIHIRGRYRTREFTGDEGTKKRYRYIEVDRFDFLPKSKPENGSQTIKEHAADPVADEIPFCPPHHTT